MKLSNRDLLLLSDGLLALIKNYGEAQKLINDERIIGAISGEIHRCQRLNSRLMSEIKGNGDRVDVEKRTDMFNDGKINIEDAELYVLAKNIDSDGFNFVVEASNISQREIAKELGIRPQNLNLWLKGKQPISKKHIPKLEKILGVSHEYFNKELTLDEKVEIIRCYKTK